MSTPNFRESQEWKAEGKNFLVVVRHWICPGETSYDDGRNRWNVYAYVYPEHPAFAEFNGPDMWQPASCKLPLHKGASMLRWHRNEDGEPTSVQVGCDFNHLHDDAFSFYETREDAHEVFACAVNVFSHLSNAEQA